MPERSVTSEHGLLEPAEAGLLTDRYELAMADSYLRRGMDEAAVFELFIRKLPPERQWLLAAGLGPALALVESISFDEASLDWLRDDGFADTLLDHLRGWRFRGDVDAIPEGTVAFADEPLLRVTAARPDAQLLETLLLNQITYQTAVATKAARVVLAAGGGEPGAGTAVVDFSARRDHGTDAAMKAARCAAIAGCGGTSNVAAARRFGLRAVGTMAHSYVLSFPTEEDAFRAFMADYPDNAVMLVDTYDTLEGVRRAIAVARETATQLRAVRLDSGDLLELSRRARTLLDEAGMREAKVMASGDLDEYRIAELVGAGAPIDTWGVGTKMGTSDDVPSLSSAYKLVADAATGDGWRGVAKRSEGKGTLPGPKQVHRDYEAGTMAGDVIAAVDERHAGEPLLVPAMRDGAIVHAEPVGDCARRAAGQLAALPARLRLPCQGAEAEPYAVRTSRALEERYAELAQH